EFHDRAARLLAAGDWRMGQPILEGCPLYLYFLGAIYRIAGAGPWLPRLVQLALGVATVALIYDSARRLFGGRWALVAGLAAALYGPLVHQELQLEPEALAAFLHALLAWSVLRLLLDGDARAAR